MTVIIGLSGKKRAGKNSVYFLAKILLDEDERGLVVKVSMADALKEMANGLVLLADNYTAFHVYTLARGLRDRAVSETLRALARDLALTPDDLRNKTPGGRHFLQFLGTDVFRRHVDDLYWVKEAERRIAALAKSEPAPVAIFVPDIRFPNEAEMVKRLGGVVWRIRRPVVEPAPGRETAAELHPSETALDGYAGFDAMLVANNMEEHFQNVKRELTRLGLVR